MFPVGSDQVLSGVCFHGGAMYASGRGNILIRYDPVTGEQLEVVDPMIPGLANPHIHGIAAAGDGTFWVGETELQRLFQLRFSDYSVVSVIDAPPVAPTYGLAFEEGTLWVGYHTTDGTPTPVHAVDPATGEVIGALEFGATDVHGLVWLGGSLYALDGATVSRVDGAGEVQDAFSLPAGWWGSLAYDGSHFWSHNLTAVFQVDLPPPPVRGDLDGDGTVGIADLLILLAGWGDCGECQPCPADLDGDCGVGIVDLLTLLAAWS
jgi:hypothetical protein